MTSKSKLVLIAAIAAATLASPAFAQSTTQNGTHQERVLRSDQGVGGSNMYDGNQGNAQDSSYPGDY
jgi:hypothetical protein